MLFLGNSLTAGLGVRPEQAFPALIQQKIDSAGLRFHVRNAGVSGATSADGLQRIDWILQGPVTVMVLELGANDALRGLDPAAMKRNLQAIIEHARRYDPNMAIVLAGMLAPPNMGSDYTRRFDAVFPDLARVDHTALVPFLLQGVAGIPSLNQADGMHPTPAGHRIVAENVWRVLKPILEKQAARSRDAPGRPSATRRVGGG